MEYKKETFRLLSRAGLTQAQLALALFPLGGLTKTEVRTLARERNLPVAAKRDSQEICFVSNDDYAGFIARRAAPGCERAGTIVNSDGRIVGRHDGVHHFTIGQRKGLRLSASVPLYVTSIDAESNTVFVGSRADLERTTLTGSRVNWIAGAPPASPLRAAVQIRSRHVAAPAVVSVSAPGRVAVEFDQPQSAVTPGQAAVFYVEDEVVGGGWID